MSEFKFACPVCGQHITADTAATGSKLSCPTCFQQIVVPQPPASDDTKLIISAAKADKPRPPQTETPPDLGPLARPQGNGVFSYVALGVALLCVAALGAWLFYNRQLHPPPPPVVEQPHPPPKPPKPPFVLSSPFAVPTNVSWGLEPEAITIPAGAPAGSVRGLGFLCQRAVLQEGTLLLRQGTSGAPDLAFTVVLPPQRAEDLTSKVITVSPDQDPPVPKVAIRWKTSPQKVATKSFTNGYLLKVIFGVPGRGKMPFKIYLSVPDHDKSFAAGTFEAEIRKPPPPKPKK